MSRDITREELEALGLSASPETGEIRLHGEAIEPSIRKTEKGYLYPHVVVYDPKRWTAKHYGNRPIFAARIIWAFAYGSCPGSIILRPVNGDVFDIRLENLRAESRRRGNQ